MASGIFTGDPIKGLLTILSEEELIEFSSTLEKFAKKTKTKATVKFGSWKSFIEKGPKQLVGVIINEIELELIKRKNDVL